MRHAPLLVLCVAGCNFVGDGQGEAAGPLFISWCNKQGDYGTPAQPRLFDLDPEFFGGEPIEDPSGRFRLNRLIIRLQRSGKRAELNDVLTFDVQNSYEVARCVRGRTVGGKPDWDEVNCFRADGAFPKLRVGRDAHIKAYFTPRTTCSRRASEPPNLVVGEAISSVPPPDDNGVRPPTDGNWQSWIQLQHFGSAQKPDTPSEQRREISRTFKVEFGERLNASRFHVELTDQRVIDRAATSAPELGGYLDGSFDFDLHRGQGAQTFP